MLRTYQIISKQTLQSFDEFYNALVILHILAQQTFILGHFHFLRNIFHILLNIFLKLQISSIRKKRFSLKDFSTKYFQIYSCHCVSYTEQYGVFSDPYFLEYEYGNTGIQSEYGKIRPRKKLCTWTLFTQCV